jgi:hypothetical protein
MGSSRVNTEGSSRAQALNDHESGHRQVTVMESVRICVTGTEFSFAVWSKWQEACS